ncbi:hypothetical protein [Streptomyces sp. NPDC059631]|uniref:hypothetical protein n=1 Tax=unclassified Streptomyces TaxID=2593676 RepID=UPI00367A8038
MTKADTRRLAPVEYRYQSRGGPVAVYAKALHARLYGLPPDDESLPTALDELLQATLSTAGPDQQAAVLQQLAEQLRNAAEILEWARDHARRRQVPDAVWEWLRAATHSTRDLADGLDAVRPCFTDDPPALATPPQLPSPQARPSTIAAPPTSPAGRRR